MSLTRKLERLSLTPAAGQEGPSTSSGRPAPLVARAPLEADVQRKVEALKRALAELSARSRGHPGEGSSRSESSSRCAVEQTPEGPLCRALARFPADHRHGVCPPSQAAQLPTALLPLLGYDPLLSRCA